MPAMPRVLVRLALAALVVGPSPILAHGPVLKVAAGTNGLAPSARPAAAMVDAFHSALRRGDTKAASGILADDVLIFESGQVEHSKSEYAAHHLGADAVFAQAVRATVTRRSGSSDGKTAWILSEGRTVGNYKGHALDLVTSETMVLRHVGSTWLIAHIHWSSGKRG